MVLKILSSENRLRRLTNKCQKGKYLGQHRIIKSQKIPERLSRLSWNKYWSNPCASWQKLYICLKEDIDVVPYSLNRQKEEIPNTESNVCTAAQTCCRPPSPSRTKGHFFGEAQDPRPDVLLGLVCHGHDALTRPRSLMEDEGHSGALPAGVAKGKSIVLLFADASPLLPPVATPNPHKLSRYVRQ